jgi:hypothetical protein
VLFVVGVEISIFAREAFYSPKALLTIALTSRSNFFSPHYSKDDFFAAF